MRITDEHIVSPALGQAGEAIDEEMDRLACLIAAHAPHDGVFSQRHDGVRISRYSQVNADYVKAFYMPSLMIVAQGAKTVTVGEEVHSFGKGSLLLLPVALPIALRTTKASPVEPFFAVRLDLDPQRISELALKVYPLGLPPILKRRAAYVASADFGMINAVRRLVKCLDNPGDAEFIAPLVMDEFLIRTLRSSIGVHAAEMGFADSSVQRVVKAISWLKDNFSHQMKVVELADLVHLSESSFHEHFKAVTSMTPLQYQKALRLHEARRLMLSSSMDATTACQQVGYVSTSQFSRDYSRFFGNPPRRDIAALRRHLPDHTNR